MYAEATAKWATYAKMAIPYTSKVLPQSAQARFSVLKCGDATRTATTAARRPRKAKTITSSEVPTDLAPRHTM